MVLDVAGSIPVVRPRLICLVCVAVLAGTAHARCPADSLADRCACLAEDVPDAPTSTESCAEVAYPALEALGLSALELEKVPGLFVGAKTASGWRVLAPLTEGGVYTYQVHRDVKVTATRRKAGKIPVIWIVTRSESISSVPDPCCMVETSITEEVTVCTLGTEPRCPVSALLVRSGSDVYNKAMWDPARVLARARKKLRTVATLTLGNGVVMSGKRRFELR